MSFSFGSSSTECPNRSAVHSLSPPGTHTSLKSPDHHHSIAYRTPKLCPILPQSLTAIPRTVLQSSLFVPFSFFSPPERPKQSSIPTTSPAIDNNCCQCFKSHNENGPIPSPFASTTEGPSTRRVQCSAAQRSASHKQTLRLLNVVRFFRTTTFVAPLSSSLSVSTKGYSLQSLVGHYTLSSYIQYTTLLSRLILSLTLLSPQARHLSLI